MTFRRYSKDQKMHDLSGGRGGDALPLGLIYVFFPPRGPTNFTLIRKPKGGLRISIKTILYTIEDYQHNFKDIKVV